MTTLFFKLLLAGKRRSSFERKSIYLYLFTTSGQNSTSLTGVYGVSTYKKKLFFIQSAEPSGGTLPMKYVVSFELSWQCQKSEKKTEIRFSC